jgi:hypothetical protein
MKGDEGSFHFIVPGTVMAVTTVNRQAIHIPAAAYKLSGTAAKQ